MLSIIVCSRNKILSKEFTENLNNTVGVDYELIAIDNSENKYSIFSAYNAGIGKSNYPYLCFVHEDVRFHTANWGLNIIAHLQDPKTGIVGAGGGDLVLRVPASWGTLISPGQNMIQTDLSGNETSKLLLEPTNYKHSKRSSITIDGVFMCMARELTKKIRFDENFTGFHGYDYDISLQSITAGCINYVVYDVTIEHFSKGNTDVVYFRNLILIFKKWEKYLPLIGNNITDKERLDIPRLEEKKLYQLTKKMARKGFEIKEIKSEITYYANIIDSKRADKYMTIRVFLIRLFNSPKYLFRR